MGFLSERVSYLRGLADGMKLDETTNEGKLLKEIIELLDDVAGSVEDLEESQSVMQDEACDTDERLEDLENEVFGDEDECGCGCGCDCCDCDDEEFFCPFCGDEIDLDECELNEDNSAIICPGCGKEIDITVEDDCDCDDDCCCCCHHHDDEGK